ncbi:1-phosphofructokinase family hexose kinase [Streptomyces sp. YIM S03343]
MILTVTLNTALDITHRVPSLRPHAAHRVTDVAERPGGKGLDVARVLAALGHEVTVTGFTGGATGRAVQDLLTAVPGIADALVPVAGATRRTVTVLDERTGGTTRLVEPGPVVTAAEWRALQEVFEDLLADTPVSVVALCGSLPPGLPVGAYAVLVRTAHSAGIPVLLDTGGEPLRRAIAARPDVVAPGTDQLAELTGSHEPFRATQDARRRGARAVVASLGPEGLLAVTPDGQWRATPPARISADVAGEFTVAGLLSGIAGGSPWPERLSRAAALSAAADRARTAERPTTAAGFDPDVYADLLTQVAVTREAPAA